MKSASPHVILQHLQTFLFFFELEPIATRHERLMETLFSREREQHPAVQVVYDLTLNPSSSSSLTRIHISSTTR
ncbi:hypothetical protein EDC04DRAFT_2763760 [Pisolithus marmoratus]|nr:hypothetical protein EDC04DRAFT_2763760 [Pisolithus marmoratus]